MDIVFIVAVAENGVIGLGNGMPWRLKSDLKRLKALTIGKPVIMGRKTFESIGRPLPNRTNIVVTRDRGYSAPGIVVTSSLDTAHEIARGDALRRFVTEIAVIGGAEIFRQDFPRATRVEWTVVHASPEGDTFMEPLSPTDWEEVARERHPAGEGESADYSYVTYRRRIAR